MNWYCTYFDHRYLPQGLALARSLGSADPGARLFILCLDEGAAGALERLAVPNVEVARLGELEAGDPGLMSAKRDRSLLEYYFTLTPSLPLFFFARHPTVALVTYVDADLFFFSDPAPIFEEFGNRSVGIFGHRFPERLKYLETHGIYNVGWVSFRHDGAGLACLSWWRERCLEWCFDRLEDGKFADQKYLDEWPRRFPGVAVLEEPGAGLGPWNIGESRIGGPRSHPLIGDRPLIFYHFHGLKRRGALFVQLGLKPFGTRPTGAVFDVMYRPYLQALRAASAELRLVGGDQQREKLSRSRAGNGESGLMGLFLEGELRLFVSTGGSAW